jgi:CRP/FNR family transcriptional regulator
MLSESEFNEVIKTLPFLKNATELMIDEFKRYGSIRKIPAGKDVFIIDDHVNAIALLLKGSVRVFIIGETGREITLYRFGSGESCVLTASAILNDQEFPAIAHVEKDATAVMIPDDKFRDWIKRFDPWRDFVFDLLSKRLFSMMAVLNEVVFRRMDQRVSAYLLEKGKQSSLVQVTHQQIASEIGTSREVVSRLIMTFQEDGLVKTGRGFIEIIDKSGLSNIAVM